MPERRTKMIPAKAARSSTRGRPPLGLAIPNQRAHAGFVRRSKTQYGVFATVFVLGLPSPLLQGRGICDGSLSSPIAWLFQMLPEKPLQAA
jgi:hypothetical protein